MTFTIIGIGVGAVVAIAVILGVVDAARARAWREVAAQRRERWEARHPEYHGPRTAPEDEGDDGF